MKNITVQSDIAIRDAMKILNKTAEKCLLLVDENNKLVGTLTDGDIRRSILSGAKISDSITNSFNNNPKVLINGSYTLEDAKVILKKNIDVIPIVDGDNTLLDYISWSNMDGFEKPTINLKNTSVVIMAGGKGTRLEPFTKILPKPLVPINEKPIIEHIISRFCKYQCDQFYITINYKGKILKAFFEELGPDYSIHFIEEKKPLGTAGGLRYLKDKFTDPFFVINCDIIIDADYSSIYKFHNDGNFDLTLIASTKEYIIPYGTCELDAEGHLFGINEKPKFDFLINTGLYIINPEILNFIPVDKFFDITSLIKVIKNDNKKIGVFPIDEDEWSDVGQWVEYKKAIQTLS